MPKVRVRSYLDGNAPQFNVADKDVNYFFDFLLNQDYIVISEDVLCEYSNSIQVGVKPNETI